MERHHCAAANGEEGQLLEQLYVERRNCAAANGEQGQLLKQLMWKDVILMLQMVRRASYCNLKKPHLIFRCGRK